MVMRERVETPKYTLCTGTEQGDLSTSLARYRGCQGQVDSCCRRVVYEYIRMANLYSRVLYIVLSSIQYCNIFKKPPISCSTVMYIHGYPLPGMIIYPGGSVAEGRGESQVHTISL